jgi:signal transduction histidine kinase
MNLLTDEKAETINLSLQDDGIGLPQNADKLGFGLRGIQERASQLGGKLSLSNRPQNGAEICLSLPLPPEQTRGESA